MHNAFIDGQNTGNWSTFDDLLGIQLTTDGTATWDTQTWNGVTFSEDVAVRAAAMDVAFGLGNLNSSLSAAQAFRNAFNTSTSDRLEIRRVSTFEYEGQSYNAGGLTPDAHLITLANLSDYVFGTARNNVVHELGHALNQGSGGVLAASIAGYVPEREFMLQVGVHEQLRFNTSLSAGETFGDFLVAFTYNTWTSDPRASQASRTMITNLSEWVR